MLTFAKPFRKPLSYPGWFTGVRRSPTRTAHRVDRAWVPREKQLKATVAQALPEGWVDYFEGGGEIHLNRRFLVNFEDVP